MHSISFKEYTTCFSLHCKWQGYKNFWPRNDVTGDSPPHGPHLGGLWEAAVKSMAYYLLRTLGVQIQTYEELFYLIG
jgi:hypothetical protein